jgi:hypothetical protein
MITSSSPPRSLDGTGFDESVIHIQETRIQHMDAMGSAISASDFCVQIHGLIREYHIESPELSST